MDGAKTHRTDPDDEGEDQQTVLSGVIHRVRITASTRIQKQEAPYKQGMYKGSYLIIVGYEFWDVE